MSLIATAAAASAASSTVNLFTHGHKKGSHAGSAKDGTAASSTQAPATTQSLLSSLFESIQQVIGISITAPTLPASATTASAGAVTATAGAGAPAAAATTTPGTTAVASAAPGSAQDVQSFLHSLLQALKADGLGGSSGATASAAGVGTGAAVGAGATSGTVRYDGSLVSSLQTLIHQVDSNGPATAATSNLSTSFNKLIQSGSGGAGVADAGSGTASQASLQNFLSNLLQNVQSSGVHSISAMGANVNAKV
jgi:hypothetical protein